ncbi:MAG: protein-glutamate O-methyltransferase CheR [Chloroflexi bacterium]|nr:protein-glutamate O-methyltransferase CheR [Chloroflexota bacterium]
MRFYSETLGLSDNAFSLLRDLVHERAGIYYENGRRDIVADKLSPLVIERGFDSFLDYYYLLKYDPVGEEEWGRIMDALTVPETYFWRETDQIHALVDVIVPRYAAERRPLPLRIWCAACATGEEPFTIAMALNETGWFDRLPIEISASDIAPKAIAKAQAGVYRDRSFRNLTGYLKTKYFTEEAGVWRLDPQISARVKFAIANVTAETTAARLGVAPVIFCRNVFIYFSDQAIRRTVRLFAHYMPAPGYLCVAAAESLLKVTTDFELQEIGGAFVYVKN